MPTEADHASSGMEAFTAGGIQLHQRLLSGLYLPLLNPIDGL